MPILAQENDDFLAAVLFDLYLNEESPLYPFAVPHPCGKTVTLRANTIPVELSTFRMLWAYELAPSGKIKTTWALPVDATPLAVDGDRLTVHQFKDPDVVIVTSTFGIGLDLNEPDRAVLPSKHVKIVECPSGSDDFELVKFHVCSELPDATTDKVRMIAYPLVCT